MSFERTRKALASIAVVASLGSTNVGLPIAIDTARAQSGSERSSAPTVAEVELIMGNLPPESSPAYEAIRSAAGTKVGKHILPLTSCEVWTVPTSIVDTLRSVAESHGASVKVLDDSWNEVFAAMSPSQPVDDTTRSMAAMAHSAPSTAGVAMLSTRTASMIEHALTKGARARTAQQSSLKLTLKDGLTVTAVRRDVSVASGRIVWRGVVEGTDDPVTIMWWATGRTTGTVHRQGRIYQIRQLGPGVIGVVETMTDMLPDEHARTTPEHTQRMRMKDDASRPNGEAPRSRPERTETDHLKDDVTAMVVPPPSIGAVSADTTPGASTLRPVVIDVMIAYTARAAMHYDDIRRDLVELTIEETNESFRASGLGHISVRLVGVHATDYSETGGQHFDHVWRMVDRGDGHLEEIPGLRNAMKADVVLLIVDDPSGCGLATRVAASEEEAYAVVHHACAASSYSVAHEIGHLLGARHDRSLDQNTTPFPYGHGYISPDLKWRTMMSYKAGCNGCARLPIWSSPNVDVKGNPAGNELTDNARVIREQAERVAAFR